MIISIHVNWTLRWRIAEATVNVIILIRRLIGFERLFAVVICTITARAVGVIVVMILPCVARPCVDAWWRSSVIVTYRWWRVSCRLNCVVSSEHFKYHFGIAWRTTAPYASMKIVSRRSSWIGNEEKVKQTLQDSERFRSTYKWNNSRCPV